MRLIDERTLDGSRQFASLPQVVSWSAVRSHLSLLPGAKIANLHDTCPERTWLDFHFGQHHFFIKAHDGLFHLFVRDPQCADLVLYQVGAHFEQLVNGDHDEKA
jgi:hypothetical protein